MTRRIVFFALLLLATFALDTRAEDFTVKDGTTVRTWLRHALERPEALDAPAVRKQIAAWNKAGAADAVAAALREGPLLRKDDRKPRSRDGKPEVHAVHDGVLTGLAFEHDGTSIGYVVALPPKYSPNRPCGVLLDPGHGTGAKHDQKGKAGFADYYVGLARKAGLTDWIVVRTEIIEQVGAEGALGPLPESQVVPYFEALLRDLATRVAIDPDRIIVTGLSQTGFWSWQLGVEKADRFAAIAPMAAVTWNAEPLLENLRNVPVRVLQGEKDTTCRPEQPRRTCARLQRMGFDVAYTEFPGAGHTPAVFDRLADVLPELSKLRRPRYPKHVSKSVATLHSPWAHWLRIGGIENVGSGKAGQSATAGIDGSIEGQTVTLRSRGVQSVTVHLATELLDLTKPVRVIWNGKTVHEGVVQPDIDVLLRTAAEKCDWTSVYSARLMLKLPK